MELRRVDPRILKKNPGNPRKIQPDEMSDAALAASIGAIGILQPPVVSEKNGELTIAYGARRVRIAIAIGLAEIDVLVKDPDDHDHMRAVSENVVRAPMLGSVLQLSCWVRTAVTAIGEIHGAYRGRHTDVRVKCSRSEARTTLDAAATPQAFDGVQARPAPLPRGERESARGTPRILKTRVRRRRSA